MGLSSTLEGAPRDDRFEVREKIGEGAMGLVFRARDREIDRDVAIKALRRWGPDDLLTLKREFRALADVRHPNLVDFLELFADDERCFITMEWIDGVEFPDFARPPDGDRASLASIAKSVRRLVLGLDHLHRARMLHQDVKPSNVMVDAAGRVVLLDFGLVAAFGVDRASWDRSRSVAGTFDYMAPEQAWGEPGRPASDLYGVGVLLYEALTGHLPYSGAQLAALWSGRARLPATPRELDATIPARLSDLTMAMISPDPDERPSAKEVLERLAREEPEAPTSTSPESGDRIAASFTRPGRDELFHGRASELASLRRAWHGVRSGHTRAMRVAGVSGIGKTRLVEHFLDEIEADPSLEAKPLVLRSRCLPEESVRFKAVDGIVDELSHFLAARAEEVSAPIDTHALMRVFPVLSRATIETDLALPPVDGAEPREIRTRAFRALRRLLSEIARKRPVVLWIDDLQWGDLDSLPLLEELMRKTDAPGLLLILSYRGGEHGPVLDAIDGGDSTWRESEQILLGPLDDIDGRALVDALLGARRDELAGPAYRIPSEAGGSPFFIGELSRLLLEGKAGDESSSSRAPLLAEVVGRRVQLLPDTARRLLEVVSLAVGPIERSAALRVAGLHESDRGLVKDLRLQSLIKIGADDTRHLLEPYHDQIREKIVAGFEPPRQRALHAALLDELEAAGTVPADRLLRHAHGCGDLGKAAHYAMRAGDEAASSLAFTQAAAFYGQALQWTAADAPARADLLSRQAEALVNAGRGLEAAPLYLQAADLGDEADALLRRSSAAEQYLVSGGIGPGLQVLQPLLDELEIPFPDSERQAMFWSMGLLLRALVRGSRFRSIEEERMAPRDRARVDLCFSASKGLVAVDTPRGGYLALRGLLFALRAGEPRRIGRSLAMVAGAVLAPAGGPLLGWARRMVSRTEVLARTFDDDYLRAISDITRGQIAVFEGKWRDALERSERGIETLTLRCRGVTWEANTGETGALRGLEELGRYEALMERAGEHAKRSADRGDLYGEIVAAAYLSIGLLAEGRPSEARAQHRAVFRRWRHGRFDVQSLYALRADVMADVYEGRPEVAYQKVVSTWPEIEAALLLRVPVTRIDALLLRARSAIECAIEGRGEVDALLASVERDARRLARESRLDARAHAAVLRAGVHQCRGEWGDMQRELDRAEALYDEEGMVVDAICMRMWRRGRIDADQAEELRQRGIHDPARWVRLVAAGFRPERSRTV